MVLECLSDIAAPFHGCTGTSASNQNTPTSPTSKPAVHRCPAPAVLETWFEKMPVFSGAPKPPTSEKKVYRGGPSKPTHPWPAEPRRWARSPGVDIFCLVV